MKRMYKVISPIEKKGGGTFWMRTGSAFTNKDDSINVYVDVVPKNYQFQLRELTEEELSRKSTYGETQGSLKQPAASTDSPIPF
ncbi:MAG: hypothetical protein JWO36_2142 [Myxococcales bacterium]|nr:hypothetical protein [Myxococcales bacterium]